MLEHMRTTRDLEIPAGWYSVGFSSELPRGAVEERVFAGHEVVLFRTESGGFGMVDAYCPHLGAHMGKGGSVEGETLRCPFHGFRFDREGACVATAYGTKAPPKARVRAWPVREKHGVLLAYFDPTERGPTWEVPELDMRGWSPFVSHRWTLAGHPQETSENSVDLGHFSVVHHYAEVALTSLTIEGPLLVASYRFERATIPGVGARLKATFDAYVHGLGYSLVDVRLPGLGLRMRQLVLPVPTVRGTIDLRVALSNQELGRMGPLGKPLARVITRALLPLVKNDVSQDFAIWKNKRYVDRPILAAGDGPIPQYRKWASQFYEQGSAAASPKRSLPVVRGESLEGEALRSTLPA
jgi:nitrite reductase/ring-hydroxylating ferredoxin subunit